MQLVAIASIPAAGFVMGTPPNYLYTQIVPTSMADIKMFLEKTARRLADPRHIAERRGCRHRVRKAADSGYQEPISLDRLPSRVCGFTGCVLRSPRPREVGPDERHRSGVRLRPGACRPRRASRGQAKTSRMAAPSG